MNKINYLTNSFALSATAAYGWGRERVPLDKRARGDGRTHVHKTAASVAEAISDIDNGAIIMIGGFGGAGAPIELIHAVIDKAPRDLTIVNNNAGNGRIGIAAMIDAGLVRKMICSFPRSSDPRAFTEKYLAGTVELELVPQGTLAERIRAGGAGIPAFYTPTSYGTELAQGKPVAEFEGRMYVQERWLKADFALIKAHLGDTDGNLTFNKAARNFSPVMCTAATQTIVQVSRIVLPGSIDPEHVVTPGIFVDRMVEVRNPRQEEELIRAGAAYP
jgi:3-oxoadipate CoA-transferase alpha subunit